MKQINIFIFLTLCCTLFSAYAVAQNVPDPDSTKDLEITHIRIGQGDATLIEGPLVDGKRKVVLFDAGDRINIDSGGKKSRDAGNIIRAVLARKKIKKIDYVIISHYDSDHIGGLVYGPSHGRSLILGFNDRPGVDNDHPNDGWVEGFKCWRPDPNEIGTQRAKGQDVVVEHWVDRGNQRIPLKNAGVLKYLELTDSMGTRVSLAGHPDDEDYKIDLGGGAVMHFIAGNGYVKGKPDRVARVSTENERSLSFWLRFGEFDYLISGDLIGRDYGSEDAEIEYELGKYISAKLDKVGRKEEGIDVLHVNHHGSNNGSEARFLNLIKPNIAVISTGNGNGHHHPHNEVLERLYNAGVDRIVQTSWGTTRNYNQSFIQRIIANKKDIYDDIRDIHSIYQAGITVTANSQKYEIGTSRVFANNAVRHETANTPRTSCDQKPSGLQREWERKLSQ